MAIIKLYNKEKENISLSNFFDALGKERKIESIHYNDLDSTFKHIRNMDINIISVFIWQNNEVIDSIEFNLLERNFTNDFIKREIYELMERISKEQIRKQQSRIIQINMKKPTIKIRKNRQITSLKTKIDCYRITLMNNQYITSSLRIKCITELNDLCLKIKEKYNIYY